MRSPIEIIALKYFTPVAIMKCKRCSLFYLRWAYVAYKKGIYSEMSNVAEVFYDWISHVITPCMLNM